MNQFTRRISLTCVATILLSLASAARAWDYEGHRLVNQLALASLPTNFPAWIFTSVARERVAFLAGEPDRWRNTPDQPLKHFNGPDHFLDMDLLGLHGLDAKSLSPFRNDFSIALAQGRRAHATNFPPTDTTKDSDHTKEMIGLLPWAIVENEGKLKSAFSYLREFDAAGTPEEIANARENAIYIMGVMGHYVGDGAQPLHTTKHHHGWVGENPNRYTTNYSIHQWIDGGYIAKFPIDTEKLKAKLRPARVLGGGEVKGQSDLFPVVMKYLSEQHEQVETLYRLDKQRKLSGFAELSQEGHDFITGQILKAGQMLGDLWLTAWQQAPPDTFLRGQLAKRKLKEGAGANKEPKTE
jgi:hypothetical protein